MAWVAETIRVVREQRGWSQSELARRLDKTQTAVSYWEAGKRAPGFEDVFDLAVVLGVPMESFIPPDRASQPVTALLRATAERLADRELQTAINELLLTAEAADPPARQIEITTSTPTHAANELLDKAAIAAPPVDIETLARRCGLLVLYRRFPDSLSGLVFTHDDMGVIGINHDHPPNRQRFTLAHELGHYLLGHHHASRGYDSRIHIHSSDATPPGYDWRAERAANEFAAEILMPPRLISAAISTTDDPTKLAQQFAVSELAMGYRLVNLGLR